MKGELVKRQDRYDLYISDGSKIASSAPNPFGKLSKENCDAIFGIFDIEKLANEETERYATITPKAFKRGFMYGFNKAIELIQPIQQKTEISVEIEMENNLHIGEIIDESYPKDFPKLKPKLDSNGYLILKQIDNV
jgi:hypothetical protein